MPKDKMNVRELINKYQENCERINVIANNCEKENRERTAAETKEYEAILRENQLLSMKLQSASIEGLREVKAEEPNLTAIVREAVKAGEPVKIVLSRESVMKVSDATAGGLVPINVQDVVEPLTEGLILDKVGLPFNTGLVGEFVWPLYEAVEASVAGEGVSLSDTKINLSKLTAKPERVGIAIPVTRQALNQSDGIVEEIIKKSIPMAFAKLLNKIMLGKETVANAVNLKGPFVDLKSGAKQFAGTIPTNKELLAMKADILKTGVNGEHLCYVMTQTMKCELEGTPKDAGSGIMICENGLINGIPVFCANYIGEGYVGLGEWRYQPAGMFGEFDLIIDPFTNARKNQIDFVANANFATVTLHEEAFVLRKGKGVDAA